MRNRFLFETKRLCIRHIEVADLDAFPQIYAHNLQTASLLDTAKLPMSIEQKRSSIEHDILNGAGNGFIFVAFFKEKNSYIGCAGLQRISWSNSCGYMGANIEPKMQGQRLGSEFCFGVLFYAFRELNLNRVESRILVSNRASISLFANLGAVHEGTLRQAQYVNGTYCDVHFMAVLKSEFEKKYESCAKVYF
ncbi:MAG: GNAT family N-acetyltransferase [Deltaproteobacteria bacterium]|nr:GNAT family N-acetyltransferase [Deltaproteobacteria bacterium]